MPISRPRTTTDIRRELAATEARLAQLVERWQRSGRSERLQGDELPSRELLDQVEELLRLQRGSVERLHQLWIELAQASGHHAPQ